MVLSSSRGTTFQAIIDRLNDGSLKAQCLGLVTDRPDRGCIEKAKTAGLPTKIVEKQSNEDREAYDRRLDAAIKELMSEVLGPRPVLSPSSALGINSVEGSEVLIAAIGWMFVLSPWFIRSWENRIVNIHPALLPKHGGEGMYGMRVHEAVLAAGEKESGITLHLMDESIDTGTILLQKTCPVKPDDTPETLRTRVQELEKEWYPKLLQMIEEGTIKLP